MPQNVLILSKSNEFGEPYLGDCTLFVGANQPLTFAKGRAMAPRELAQLLADGGNKQVEIPDLGYKPADVRPAGVAATLDQSSQPTEIPEEIKALLDPDNPAARLLKAVNGAPADRVEALIAALAADDEREEEEPEPKEGADPSLSGPPPEHDGSEEESERVRLAKEALAADGEHVPEVEQTTPRPQRVVPAAFENVTGTGEIRCLAPKADGSQCLNAAADGSNACSIAKHKEALGETA